MVLFSDIYPLLQHMRISCALTPYDEICTSLVDNAGQSKTVLAARSECSFILN